MGQTTKAFCRYMMLLGALTAIVVPARAHAANWGALTPKECVEVGKRKYSGVLDNIPWGASWEAACAGMAADIGGVHFNAPNKCVNTGTAMWGEFHVSDDTCDNDAYTRLEGTRPWSEMATGCWHKRMAKLDEVCPKDSSGTRTLRHGAAVGDVWLAVSDRPNLWVSIGTRYPERTCKTHEEVAGVAPAWGLTTGPEAVTGKKAALLCIDGPAVPQVHLSGKEIFLKNVDSGRAFAPDKSKEKQDGAEVRQYADGGAFGWVVRRHPTRGHYWLVNKGSGLCLDANWQLGNASLAPVRQSTCHSGDTQAWRFVHEPNSEGKVMTLQNRMGSIDASNLCLQPESSSTHEGIALRLLQCQDVAKKQQFFWLYPKQMSHAFGMAGIVSMATSRTLAIARSGPNVFLQGNAQDVNTQELQTRWEIVPMGGTPMTEAPAGMLGVPTNGTLYRIRSLNILFGDRCLGVPTAHDNGAPVQEMSCNPSSGAAPLWLIESTPGANSEVYFIKDPINGRCMSLGNLAGAAGQADNEDTVKLYDCQSSSPLGQKWKLHTDEAKLYGTGSWNINVSTP